MELALIRWNAYELSQLNILIIAVTIVLTDYIHIYNLLLFPRIRKNV